jgi:hypothetical protein
MGLKGYCSAAPHGVEQVLHARGLRHVAVDEVLVAPADDDLARHRDLLAVLVPRAEGCTSPGVGLCTLNQVDP